MEEVHREDDRAIGVETIDRRVVGGIETDEEIFGLSGHEAGEEV